MNDEYIIKVFNDGTRYYYKNSILHREIGPAILIPEDKEYFTDLSDSNQYKEVVIEEDAPYKKFHNKAIIYIEDNGVIKRFHTMPIYYLNGDSYSDEDFERIKSKMILKNELSSELTKIDSNNKKLKI